MRFKMRFFNLCTAKAMLRNFESDRMDVIAFDGDLTPNELKEFLESVTDGHVMADAISRIADLTGEQF